jgi:membrane associated rhomboid family serine protease
METVVSYIAIAVIVAALGIIAVRRYSPTLVLVAANMAVYGISMFDGFVIPGALVEIDLSFKSALFFSGAEPWTILTSMFVHADVIHLLMNTIFLLLVGLPLESRIGKWRFMAIYLLGGMAGTLIFTIAEPYSGFHVMLVGASGAISALFGAMVMLYPREKILLPLGIIITNRFSVTVCAGVWLALQLFLYVFDTVTPVAYAAHLGGFAAGAAIAWMVRPRNAVIKGPRRSYDITPLEKFCTTASLKEMYKYAETAWDEETKMMWVERIMDNMRCPECGAPAETTEDGFVCGNGHRMR